MIEQSVLTSEYGPVLPEAMERNWPSSGEAPKPGELINAGASDSLSLGGDVQVMTAGSGPGLLGAITWLKANQNPSGSWGNPWFEAFRPTTEVRDTATVLRALEQAGQGSAPSVLSANAFLDARIVFSTDYRARAIFALRNNAVDVAGRVSDLLAARESANHSGAPFGYLGDGWGAAPGYESSSVDTALAVLGLDAVGLVDGYDLDSVLVSSGQPLFLMVDVPIDGTSLRIDVESLTSPVQVRVKPGDQPTLGDPGFGVSQPVFIELPTLQPLVVGRNWIRVDAPSGSSTLDLLVRWDTPTFSTAQLVDFFAFLSACQNSDGGFGHQPGAASHLWTTLQVLRAMGIVHNRYSLESVTTAGANYVRGFQSEPGGVGFVESTPTAQETALAKIVFGLLEFSAEESLARSALLMTQDAGGHWESDPYVTGLAVQALTVVPEPEMTSSIAAGTVLLALAAARERRRVGTHLKVKKTDRLVVSRAQPVPGQNGRSLPSSL